jgi:hypothetical protein
MSTVEKFREDFERISSAPPPEGAILRAFDPTQPVCLTIDLIEGKEPFIYSQAYVPTVVGCEIIGWCARTLNEPNRGFKCILMSKARDEVIRRNPGLPKQVLVKALRVVKLSQTGHALLCEVHEWEDVPVVEAE